jgi:hypothetical protein
MPLVESQHIIAARRLVEPLDVKTAAQFLDELADAQPALLGSVLVLPRFGVRDADIDIALTLLLICCFAARDARPGIRKVTEEDQDQCLDSLVAHQRYALESAPEFRCAATETYVRTHREPLLLAFVLDYLKEHDLHRVRTEPEKYLTLCMLALVDSLALVLAEADTTR